MKKIKKILACVDLSDYSVMTLDYAVTLAKGSQADIIVFTVINQRDVNGVEMISGYFPGYFVSDMNAEEYAKELKKDRTEKINNMIEENFPDDASMMTLKIDMGIPFECILNAVETEGADLIVMANKGRGNLSRVFFGSVAEKVFRHSPVPVVSVRDKMKFKRGH
jgi:nucleotide-binding universal stress UspA family protein